MVGAYGGPVTAGSGSANKKEFYINRFLYIPLEFWFCRNVGLALPLIALQYHEVKINLNFESADNCKGTSAALLKGFGASIWVDYIFLDTDERRRFAQLSHEYLIEQLQFTGQEAIASQSIKPKLNFNHPCKELVWFTTTNAADNNNWMNYTTNAYSATELTYPTYGKCLVGGIPVNTDAEYFNDATVSRVNEKLFPKTASEFNHTANAKLVLNGNDRFSTRNGSYFNLIQPFQHHENTPANAGINVYSFALKPEEHQPSGTLNMSRIDTAVLNLTMNPKVSYSTAGYNLYVYAVNYNVLRILSGMGGLAYSN